MANPICLSPLKFYEDKNWQTHRMSYAFEHISPLIQPFNTIPAFQFVLPSDITSINKIYIHSAFKVAGFDTIYSHPTYDYITIDATQEIIDAGLDIYEVEEYKLVLFYGEEMPDIGLTEGEYYIEIVFNSSDSNNPLKHFYSEIICYTNNIDKYLEIRYRNNSGNFYIKGGIITFPETFQYRLFFATEIGKPEYTFEEEATKRLGYSFVESQVSKKVYRFNVVAPEYICDAMRLIRLCDDKKLIYKGQEFDMLNFSMDVDWQTQGDLASVNCEFETDNIIVNLGNVGFIPNN